MSAIKKVWIDKHDGGMVELSLQSEHVQPKGMRLRVIDKTSHSSIGAPASIHIISVKLLSVEDLELIVEAIEEHLEGE